MKSSIPYAVAALLAAGALQHAAAQAPADDALSDAPTIPYAPAWVPKQEAVPAANREGGRNLAPGEPLTYVQEPVASVSRSDGLMGELASSIAQSINADESLRNSKITVVPDENGQIVLTGSTMTRAQAQKAAEIATGHAGAGTVVNAILDAET